MSRRLLHNVLLAVAVVALALVLFLKPEETGPRRFALSSLGPERVTRIELAPRQGPPIVLQRQGEEWRLTAPFPARADRFRVDALLALLNARSETRLPARDLAKYELAPPQVRLRVVAGDREQVFEFGARQPLNDQVYVATGGQIYLISPVHLLDVSRGATDFVSKKPLAEGESPVGFMLPGLTLTQVDGRWRREPDDGRLSADQINRFADEWRLANALAVERAGASRAREVFTIALAGGRALRFALLAREPEVILRREDEGLEYRFPRDVGERLLDPAEVGPEP